MLNKEVTIKNIIKLTVRRNAPLSNVDPEQFKIPKVYSRETVIFGKIEMPKINKIAQDVNVTS